MSGSKTARTLVTNMGVLALGEMSAKVFTLAAFARIGRLFGPDKYGVIEFSISTAFMMALVVDFGLGAMGAREIAKGGSVSTMTARVLSSRILLAFCCVLAMAALALALGRRGNPDATTSLLLFALTLVPTPFLLQWVFQGAELMTYVGVAQVVRFATFAAGIFLLARPDRGLWVVPVAELAAVAACAGYTMAVYRRRFGPLPPLRSLSLDTAMLWDCLPIAASQVMWALKYVFATVLLGLLAPAADVGIFGASMRITVALHSFVALYLYNLLPAFSRCQAEPRETLQTLVSGSSRIAAWIGVSGCCVGVTLSGLLFETIYGAAFERATAVFQIQLVMLLATLISAHYRVTLIAFGRQSQEMLSMGAGGVTSVVLLPLLFDSHGLVGASVAMLAGEVVTLAVSWAFVETHVVPTSAWRSLAAPLATGAVFALLFVLLPPSRWAGVGIALLVCGAGLALLDRQTIRGVVAFAGASRR